jgi:hypothetical protein
MNRFATLFCAGLSGAAGAWAAAAAVMIAVAIYAPLPVSDQWWAPTAADNGTNLFAQHNEHRLSAPRLVFLADFAFAGGSGLISLTTTFLLQAAHVVLVTALAMRGDHAAGPAGRVIFGGMVAALFFWGQQYENFASGFQVQFVGVFTLATAAFYAAAADRPRVALALAATAAATMANGLLVAPLLAAMFIASGREDGGAQRMGSAVAAAALTVVAFALYFNGYVTPSHHARPLTMLLEAPHKVAMYVFAYLGGPFGGLISADPTTRTAAALVFGVVGCGAAPFALRRAWVAEEAARPWRRGLAAAMIFAFGAAALTGLGRANFPLEQAFASRYVTPAVLYWAALAGLLRPACGRRFLWRSAAALAAVAAAGVAATQSFHLGIAEKIGDDRRMGAAAILTGVDDVRTTPHVLPYAAFGLGEMPRVRAARVGVFREAWTGWMGKTLDEVGAPPPVDACRGAAHVIEAVPDATPRAWRLQGDVALPDGGKARAVLASLADDGGRIVGLGLADPFGEAWHAYAVDDGRRRLQLIALSADRRSACRLGEPFTPPVVLGETPSSRIGPALKTDEPKIEGAWRRDGYNAAAGTPTWSGPVFGSWVASDADVGELTWTATLGGARRFVVPLVVGPSAAGLSASVIDPRDGRRLAQLDQPHGAVKWTTWLVELPDGFDGDAAVLRIRDAGQGWGQWLAVGAPRSLLGP